jgi:ariadne-1
MDSPEQTLRAAGEPAPAPAPASGSGSAPPRSPTMPPAKRARYAPAPATPPFTCEICYDEPAASDASTLRCGHRFCNGCWGAYASSKVKDEGRCMLPCMSSGCACIVDAPTLRRVLDAGAYDRYAARRTPARARADAGEVEDAAAAELRRRAPGPALLPAPGLRADDRVRGRRRLRAHDRGPDGGVRRGPHALRRLRHGREPPAACVCARARVAQERARGRGHRAVDPREHARVPEVQGRHREGRRLQVRAAARVRATADARDSRMVCRHCSFQFCWMCMKDWDVHGYNDSVCSTWKEPDLTDDMTAAKRHLERWLFYFDRFNNHELSAKLDVELLERAAERITQVQDETGMSWIEAQYMREAVAELSRCRLTLKWTYAMAHFLESGNDKQIFEDIQSCVACVCAHVWSERLSLSVGIWRLPSRSSRNSFRKRSSRRPSRTYDKIPSTRLYVCSDVTPRT